jgi:hypothetical protein
MGGTPQNGWLMIKKPFKWMIWRNQYQPGGEWHLPLNRLDNQDMWSRPVGATPRVAWSSWGFTGKGSPWPWRMLIGFCSKISKPSSPVLPETFRSFWLSMLGGCSFASVSEPNAAKCTKKMEVAVPKSNGLDRWLHITYFAMWCMSS